ncbi:unnamed protein product [Coffea canephora]|uniref:Uncharacterized protein n=1 Tax=Coffea canephora TaxID=49390 RepID=A0A068TYU9_COFCA|nr:unnamed protein product [Coffea canephora]
MSMGSGLDLSEVYVMRKLHKEKMKGREDEAEEAEAHCSCWSRKKVSHHSSTGCFSMLPFKKVRPSAKNPSTHSSQQSSGTKKS